MTTLWEKIQAEIATLEGDFTAFEEKVKEFFVHHASVDMGKTADVVLAAPPPNQSVDPTAPGYVAPQQVAPTAEAAAPAVVQPTIKVEPPALAVDATPVDIAPAPVAPVAVEAVPVPPAA